MLGFIELMKKKIWYEWSFDLSDGSSTPNARVWIRVLVCHMVLSRGWGGPWWQRQILSALFNPHTFLKLNVKPWFHSVFICGSVHSCNLNFFFFSIMTCNLFANSLWPCPTPLQLLMSSKDHYNITDCTWLSVRKDLNMQWIISLLETHL